MYQANIPSGGELVSGSQDALTHTLLINYLPYTSAGRLMKLLKVYSSAFGYKLYADCLTKMAEIWYGAKWASYMILSEVLLAIRSTVVFEECELCLYLPID